VCPPSQHANDDATLFAPDQQTRLSAATRDLTWLLGRGYALNPALKLVGDRYQLRARQRTAVQRCAAAPDAVAERLQKEHRELVGRELDVDGFNLIITIETALAGGLVLRGADGALRDLAGVRGSYRAGRQTLSVLDLVGRWCREASVARVRWWLDAPVSHSGELAATIRSVADEQGWNWQAQTSLQVDEVVAASSDIAVSSDSFVLDRCACWANLARWVIESSIPAAWIVSLPA